MATFAYSTFSHASYATLRPVYPLRLYKTLLAYHQGPKSVCVDIGCGHGIIANEFASSFTRVMATDPSSGMLDQARSLNSGTLNIDHQQSPAEDLSFLESASVDMVVSGQAAHWFDYSRFFPEMNRILRKGATLALWGYKDHAFVNHPKATEILNKYAYGKGGDLLGDYWQQPGRSIVQNKYRDIEPPEEDWEDVQRIEYEPETRGRNSGKGTLFMEKRIKLEDCMNYIRTWSSYHGWQEEHPDCQKREAGGKGDIIDQMFDDMVKHEPEWGNDQNWKDREVDIEWGSGLILARRR
ncbi:hypothetical protein MMC34_005900 [Xylographa carneopallida]|nr:hypothetical protein [Xylographa carneopallida]